MPIAVQRCITTDFSELTTPMINEFIDKILVHAPYYIDGERMQEVEIYLNFIGKFEVRPWRKGLEPIHCAGACRSGYLPCRMYRQRWGNPEKAVVRSRRKHAGYTKVGGMDTLLSRLIGTDKTALSFMAVPI